MKTGIHPATTVVNVKCNVCGSTYTFRTTLSKDFTVAACSHCHPAYTGKSQDVIKTSRVSKFLERQKKSEEMAKSK